jgi:hypothetical protein
MAREKAELLWKRSPSFILEYYYILVQLMLLVISIISTHSLYIMHTGRQLAYYVITQPMSFHCSNTNCSIGGDIRITRRTR